jgi:MoaA/NifB/PqqE/SkfB family radical SAM enzyme
MATGAENNMSSYLWKVGIDKLKNLGCGFIAFYGAEPFVERPDDLCEVVGHAESIGIHTTVISSGAALNFDECINRLHENGGRSLSMSYDPNPVDTHSYAKSRKAIETLEYFKELELVRDVATITTLTSQNAAFFAKHVAKMSSMGIWSMFDIIHADRGQPGSKCRNFPGIEDLMFDTGAGLIDLGGTLAGLQAMKKEGAKVHTSTPFIAYIDNKIQKFFAVAEGETDEEELDLYDWNCAQYFVFPSWLTIDCDGTVYPCDDFQPDAPMYRQFHICTIDENFRQFEGFWRPITKRMCPGCLWNTHFDCHLIKQGVIPFEDYVHTKD